MSPTFVRHRRASRAALAVAAALGAITGGQALLPGAAHAGTFKVSQCKTVGIAPASAFSYDTARWFSANVGLQFSGCTGDGSGMYIVTANRRLYANEVTTRGVALPESMTGTTIAAVDLAYNAPPQATSTNPAYFFMHANGARLMDQNTGTSTTGTHYTLPAASRQVQFDMWCSPVNGPGYCNWAQELFSIDGLTLTLAESVDPTADVTGPLAGAGAQSGTRPVEVSASDADSGVHSMELRLGSTVVAGATMSCQNDRLNPCPASVTRNFDVDTTMVADGSHLLRLIVTDLAGNAKTIDKGYVAVDNVPAPSNTALPTIAGEKRVGQSLASSPGTWSGSDLTFQYRWERYEAAGWESIPDATSSAFTPTTHEVGKRIRLRVTASNSEGSSVAYSDATNPVTAPGRTDPLGDFDGDGIVNQNDPDDDNDNTPDLIDPAPFDPAVGPPSAAGGGVGVGPGFQTPNGQGASPAARLESVQFTDNRSQTIKTRYGQMRRIGGTLRGADGRPIAGATLEVTSETLVMGSRPVAAGTVTTDATGRFAYTVGAGPSRRIVVGYKAYRESSSYAHTTAVTVNVVPRVTLKVNKRSVRNKQSVRFLGKVAGAPSGVRKVVEFQAFDGRGWRTFGTARLSRSGGKFAYSYRFERTTRATTYRFRAVVRSEQGWPFLSGQSAAAKVSVRP